MVELFDCENTSLRKGSKGSKVKQLQTNLQSIGYYLTYGNSRLVVDGSYGYYTQDAVKKFQKANGLTVDGWFGPKTCKVLNAKITNKQNEEILKSKNNTITTGSASTSISVTTKKHEIQNVFTKEQANLNIGGLYLIASTVTPTNPLKNGSWKELELTDNTTKVYKSHTGIRKYSVECYLSHSQYTKMLHDLYIISTTVVDVTSDTMIVPGKYVVDITVAEERIMEKKLSLTLIEYSQ